MISIHFYTKQIDKQTTYKIIPMLLVTDAVVKEVNKLWSESEIETIPR